ncbi:hypothetical protein ABPG75_013458 [Micractinium tetrahymenae]
MAMPSNRATKKIAGGSVRFLAPRYKMNHFLSIEQPGITIRIIQPYYKAGRAGGRCRASEQVADCRKHAASTEGLVCRACACHLSIPLRPPCCPATVTVTSALLHTTFVHSPCRSMAPMPPGWTPGSPSPLRPPVLSPAYWAARLSQA